MGNGFGAGCEREEGGGTGAQGNNQGVTRYLHGITSKTVLGQREGSGLAAKGRRRRHPGPPVPYLSSHQRQPVLSSRRHNLFPRLRAAMLVNRQLYVRST